MTFLLEWLLRLAHLAGTITVVDQQNTNTDLPNVSTASSYNSTGPLEEGDTAGTLMVPSVGIDMYVRDLTSKGFTIDRTYNFKDIHAGDEQTLLVWTISGKSSSSPLDLKQSNIHAGPKISSADTHQ
jgi:hypothetical protein